MNSFKEDLKVIKDSFKFFIISRSFSYFLGFTFGYLTYRYFSLENFFAYYLLYFFFIVLSFLLLFIDLFNERKK